MNLSRRLSIVGIALLLAGCGGLNLGAQPAVSWYTLNDLRPAAKPAVAPPQVDKVLLIAQSDANPFYDSTQLAFARSDSARGYYQYAAWTERPPKRLATLIERRLAARGQFSAVANNTAGIRGDMLLNLALDEIYHDTSVTPQQARIVMQASLIDVPSRSLIARRTFVETAPVDDPDAVSAVAALNAAATALTDHLTQWVEEKSERRAKTAKSD